MNRKNDGSSNNMQAKRWGLLAIVCAAPVFFMFAYFGQPGRGRAAAIVVAILIVAVGARWDLKKNTWFWIAVTIVTACQIPLIVFVPWSSKSYPGYTLFPIGAVDFLVVYGAIKLAEKVVKTQS